MKIIESFAILRCLSDDFCNHVIEKEAKILQKNNKKEYRLDYSDYFQCNFLTAKRYTEDEISYMVFHAIDKFDSKHCGIEDPLAYIKFKVEDNYIVIINNNYKEK